MRPSTTLSETPASLASALLPRIAPIGGDCQHLHPRRGRPGGRLARTAHADPRGLAARRLVGQAQGHGQSRALRRQGVAGEPIDELAQRVGQGRRLDPPRHLPQVRAAGALRHLPDHTHRLTRPERHLHDIARRQDQPGGHGVAIGVVERERDQDIGDAGHGLFCMGTMFYLCTLSPDRDRSPRARRTATGRAARLTPLMTPEPRRPVSGEERTGRKREQGRGQAEAKGTIEGPGPWR